MSLSNLTSFYPRLERLLLDRYPRLPMDLGLERMHAVFDAMGHPERAMTTVTVAGTNGKGTTAALLAWLLQRSGLRVGLFTSPHLVSVRERFRVDGVPATPAQLAPTFLAALASLSDLEIDAPEWVELGRAQARADGWSRVDGSIGATFFELTCAMAVGLFRQEQVDVAVLEVGLGGRFDAVNATDPVLTVITPIDRDHEKWLGSTLSAIAREKAATLRSGRKGLIASGHEEAVEAIVHYGHDIGALVEIVEPLSGALPLWLQGDFAINAGLAVRAFEVLTETDADVASLGLGAFRWPGRRDRVVLGKSELRGPWLLDGAHNPAGAKALVDYCGHALPVVGCLGVSAGKDILGMVEHLKKLPIRWIVTAAEHERAMDAQELARIVQESGLDVCGVFSELGDALRDARQRAGSQTALVCGSLYLLGSVLSCLEATESFFGLDRG